MGVYGFKPNVMDDIITGKRVSVRTSIAAFWRTVGGDMSPLDMDIAMQMIYKLFTSDVRTLTAVLLAVHSSIQRLAKIHLVQDTVYLFRDTLSRKISVLLCDFECGMVECRLWQ